MKLVSGLELELALLGKAFLSGILLTVPCDKKDDSTWNRVDLT